MRVVTMFEAEDGKQFHNEDQCLEYEQKCADVDAANDMLKNGATLMAALTHANQTRPLWDNNLSLEDKALLMNTTKDTGFTISHWQGSLKPGYKPCRLRNSARVQILLSGDVGCWSGTYGDWVDIEDLLRYARSTLREAAVKENRK